jgi:hypothetical protein
MEWLNITQNGLLIKKKDSKFTTAFFDKLVEIE